MRAPSNNFSKEAPKAFDCTQALKKKALELQRGSVELEEISHMSSCLHHVVGQGGTQSLLTCDCVAGPLQHNAIDSHYN